MAIKSPTTATLDEVVMEWLSEATCISKSDKLRVLGNEIAGRQRCRTIRMRESYNDEHRALTSALEDAASSVDIAAQRVAAERVTVSTDLDTLYELLDPGCALVLRLSGGPARLITDTEKAVDELCEQQESILGHRSSLATSLTPIGCLVRSVSEVRSWPHRPRCRTADSIFDVGTYVTYYADVEETAPYFSFLTMFAFGVDGSKIEGVERTLVVHDLYNAHDVLRAIHFGIKDPADPA